MAVLEGEILVTVLMPCLDEEETLGQCIDEARAALRKLQCGSEILVVDNGSSDRSAEIARSKDLVRVIDASPRGYGVALRHGFSAARGRYIFIADADGSYSFEDLPRFVEALEGGGGAPADVVIGCRLPEGGGTIEPGAMTLANLFGNRFLSRIARALFGLTVRDLYCGVRAVRREALSRLMLQREGMDFAMEFVIEAGLSGLAVKELPVTLRPDGRSGNSHLRPLRDGVSGLLYLFGRRITRARHRK